ncbi:MAG: DNA mismatch repair protein MutS [Candidatus Sericytochromatia bacterium]
MSEKLLITKIEDYKKPTPMMEQYISVKKKYPNVLLLYRMGDFYECFFEDAEILSKALNVILTARAGSEDEGRVAMAGIPHHALESYLSRLIRKGFKVALCDQMEQAVPGKLVKREVTRVITPGTLLENTFLAEKQNNFLACVYKTNKAYSIAFADISTGEFKVTQISGINAEKILYSELERLPVSECLLPCSNPEKKIDINNTEWKGLIPDNITVTWHSELFFDYKASKKKILAHFKIKSLEGFGLHELPLSVSAIGACLSYIEETQMKALNQFKTLSTYLLTDYLVIDAITKRNLELFATSRDNLYQGSLLSIIDDTKTPMGGRLLRNWLLNPLLDKNLINFRLDAVEELTNKNSMRLDIRETLLNIKDMERLAGRASIGLSNAKELVALSISINSLPKISFILDKYDFNFSKILKNIPEELLVIGKKIDDTLIDTPPHSITEGGLIKDGIDAKLDELKNSLREAKEWLTQLEISERERTGIKSLKVAFNKNFGYFIEITNANKHLVPTEYIRKQTLSNNERYITPELKEKENFILKSEEKIKEIEYNIFCKLREEVSNFTEIIQKTAYEIAKLDIFSNFAELALKNKYVRPEIIDKNEIIIKGGRHPVIEQILPSGEFVPNDLYLNNKDSIMMILTGPNMAGKSTFMRQTALIILLAQMGCFVPADKVITGIFDRIFTRVGAVDDLSTGQSTFMVEMNETANILNNATENSFILLDEVGRGTSTYDGVSIAWSVSEYIVKEIKAKTIFATHYHELNKLEDKIEGVKNYQVSVQETTDKVIFLHKVVTGGADRSYGVEVARLAGLPQDVIKRAKEIQLDIEKRSKIQASLLKKTPDGINEVKSQLSMFEI